MWDSFASVEPNEQAYTAEREQLDQAIAQARNDDGHAVAFIYAGRDADMQMLYERNFRVYAMVRPHEKGAQQLRTVDYFMPSVLLTPGEEFDLIVNGFVRTGYIDDHYNDVFGLCNEQYGTAYEEVYAPSLQMAVYGRLPSVTADEAAKLCAEWWLQSPPSIKEAKGEIVGSLRAYKAQLREFYHSYLRNDCRPS